MAGVPEAWDGAYWWVWLAATAGFAGLLGWMGPRLWWLWPFVLAASQFVAMLATNPMGGPLAPVGLCFMLGTAWLNLLPAALGAILRRGFS
jgi:hypothetical protein